jgi:hypothetical protein
MHSNRFAGVVGLILAFTLCAMFAGCAKTRKAGGQMDTPETHYKQGMKYWDAGEWTKAEEEFKLAQSLDPKFAPAVAGLALTTAKNAQLAKTEDETKTLFKEADKLADKAKGIDSKIPQTWIAKAIVITMENEGKVDPKKWLKDVENEYQGALKVDPNNSEAYYRRGVCYKKAFEFKKAGDDFRKVLDLQKDYTGAADKEWELIQKIERAAPGTEVGRKIALVDQINRADIAALFMTELNIDKLMAKKMAKNYDTGFQAPTDQRQLQADNVVKMAAVTDVEGHWAKNFIMDIVKMNIRGLEPFPDHTFHADDLINRGAYAMMVEDVLIAITGDKTLATKHIGTQSRFPDVNPSHPAYNAICNAVDKGIMDGEMNGEFGLEKSVSGADALLVIRKIKELNKIE